MIDTHCHVDLYEDPISVAKRAETAQITTIAVTHLPSHYELAEQHLSPFKHVIPALGLHPMCAADHPAEMRKFRQFVGKSRAIGEVGLDFSSKGKPSRSIQEASFGFVLDNLKGRNKFVTLHSRGAEDEVRALVNEAKIGPVVFHWFSGSRVQLLRVIDAGHLISINTAMIKSSKWDDLINVVPSRLILTESDGPFAKCGTKAATPEDMATIVDWLARKWKRHPNDAQEIIAANFERLFGGL